MPYALIVAVFGADDAAADVLLQWARVGFIVFQSTFHFKNKHTIIFFKCYYIYTAAAVPNQYQPMPKRKLPEWITSCIPKTARSTPSHIQKAVDDAELAIDILEQDETSPAASFKEWGICNFMEDAEEEEEQEFNLSDSDVAGNMSTEETLAILQLTGIYKGTADEYPHMRDRGRLLGDLRAAITLHNASSS
jgi:hypothetical protein